MSRRAWLAGSLLALALRAAPARAEVDARTLAMVEAFIAQPPERLPPDYIDRFLSVDPLELPKRLRRPFEARRLELYSLKQLARRKKAGTVIMADDNCEVPHEAKSREISLLRFAGYQEISQEEKQWVGRRTKCTDRDMLCDFTLQIVDEAAKKGRRRYFLYCKGAACDPLYVLIGTYRARINDRNTPFFGVGGPVCTR